MAEDTEAAPLTVPDQNEAVPADTTAVPAAQTANPVQDAEFGQNVGPIMGQFVECPPGSSKFSVRVGGKPNHTWTDLEEHQQLQATPFHFRKMEVTDDVKGFNLRSKGLKERFGAKEKKLVFQNHVWSHLRSHGLDTISYLPDPANESKVVDVIHNHARFSNNMKNSLKLSRFFSAKFDNLDQANDSAARFFLLDSLEGKLELALERKIKDDDTFAIVWLNLLQLLVSPSKTKLKMQLQ